MEKKLRNYRVMAAVLALVVLAQGYYHKNERDFLRDQIARKADDVTACSARFEKLSGLNPADRADVCTAWWFGSNNLSKAKARMCRNG